MVLIRNFLVDQYQNTMKNSPLTITVPNDSQFRYVENFGTQKVALENAGMFSRRSYDGGEQRFHEDVSVPEQQFANDPFVAEKPDENELVLNIEEVNAV